MDQRGRRDFTEFVAARSLELIRLAITAYSVGSVLGGLTGGELVHRIGPRATITAAMLGSATLLALVPAFSRPAMFGLLIAALLLAGLATQSYRPAAAVLLSDLMPDDARVMGFR